MKGILSRQRYSNDKSGHGYSKFDKLSTSKFLFVKESDQYNKEKLNKVQNVHHHPKKRFVKKNHMFLDIEATLFLHVFIVV